MALTLRNVKGSPLTHTELDDNFTYLSSSIASGGGTDLTISGSFTAERVIISANTSSATPGGLTTSNNLRVWVGNNGFAIGGSQGSNGVNGVGFVISEDPSNGNHNILSDGSGSNLNIRAGGSNEGDSYVNILADQAGSSLSDIFTIAKFGGPLRGTELYHTGSLVLHTTEIGANKAVVITGTLSASADVYLPQLPNTTTPHIVGFDTASGQLTYYSTGSFGGGSTDYVSNVALVGTDLTFTGIGSAFNSTVDLSSLGGGGSTDITDLNNFTGSADTRLNNLEAATGSYLTGADTGSFVYSGSFDGSTTLTLYSADTNYNLDLSVLAGGSTDITALNNFTGSASTRLDNLEAATSSYLTAADTGSFLYSGSYDSAASAITLYSIDANYTLDLSGLAGGGGGFPITASNEGVDLTNSMSKIDFVGNAVTATNFGSIVTVTINTGSAASGDTLYTADGELTGNREVLSIDKTLLFQMSGSSQFLVSDGSLVGTGQTWTLQVDNQGVYLDGLLSNDPTANVVAYDAVTTKLSYFSTSSLKTDITALNTFTGSANTRLGDLEAATGSYLTAADTGSFLYSGSFDGSTTLTLYSVDTNYSLDLSALAGGSTDITALNNFTGSASTRLDNLEAATGSYVFSGSFDGTSTLTLYSGDTNYSLDLSALIDAGTDITALNNFTGSASTRLDNLEAATGSYVFSGSFDGTSTLTLYSGDTNYSLDLSALIDASTDITALNNFTGSASTRLDNLEAATSSFVTNDETGSFYYSSSISNATITFNQGDGTTEQVTVNNVNNAVSASYAPTIYTSDGSLTGGRNVVLDGNTLSFVADQGETFEIASDPSSNVQIPGLTTGTQAQVVGYDSSTGKLYAMNTGSIAGGTAVDTGSLLLTGSVSNATLTFTKGNGSTFPLTVNNVANATTAGSVSSDSIYSDAAPFDIWSSAGSTFTLLDIGGTTIQVTAPKNAEGGSKLLAVTTMEVYRNSSAGGAEHTTFEYRLYNIDQTTAIPGSTRNFSSYMLGTQEGPIPTTFTFTIPISSDVNSGDTIQLQVRESSYAQLGTYSSASISYADLSLVSITT